MRITPLYYLALLLLPLEGNAQWMLAFDSDIPVQRNGVPLDLAWGGGLNSVQVSNIDLNGDGIKDLLLFERMGNKVITLINSGTPGVAHYSITREFDHVHPFPLLHDWVLLRDYNCDGKEDIFTYTIAGFAVYKNISTPDSLAFELVDPQVRSDYVGPSGASVNANLFISAIDLPGLVDVDGDGDLDVLTFSLWGTTVEYHKNLSMELYGTCDSLKFELRNKCWGFFMEGVTDNTVMLDFNCDFNVLNPEISTGDARVPMDDTEDSGSRTHAGSALTPLDLNGDGVMDLLLGDISYNNIVALVNGGTTDLADMISADEAFPSNDVPVDIPIFPAAFHLDVDNDGRRDLLVSPSATSLSDNYRSLWYYKNIGTDANPVFDRQQQDLFQGHMLDFGEGAFPVAFDHDGDGLMDLVVANHGYFDLNGLYFGRLALLRNVGTTTAPAFELVTDDYMGLSSSNIGLSMYPAFADLDGDGDMDMMIGGLEGTLHYFENVSTGPEAQFQLAQPDLTDANGTLIDVGQFATPQFFDLDGDGLMDMIVGERNGNLNHYRNTGTPQVPTWTLISDTLGGVNTSEHWNITGYSVPSMFRNVDGDREILLGSESGWLYHYGDIEGNVDGNWTLLDSMFMDLRDGIRTGVCVHDFDGDGIPDVVVGNYRGGLSFWRSDMVTGTDLITLSLPAFRMIPNPASSSVEVHLSGALAGSGSWVIRNSIGQEVSRYGVRGDRTDIPLGTLADGVYLVRLEGPTMSATQRLMVVQGDRR